MICYRIGIYLPDSDFVFNFGQFRFFGYRIVPGLLLVYLFSQTENSFCSVCFIIYSWLPTCFLMNKNIKPVFGRF